MTSSSNFVKLYGTILDSTLWCEPDRTRLVWVTMLAMADQFGRVMASVPGLANRARVPVDDARAAIQAFLSPDHDSRTRDFEGRRIEAIDGGWRLLNHAKYRDLRSDDDRREQNRLAQQRRRERQRAAAASAKSAGSMTSQHESAESAHTYTEADTEKEISPSPSAQARRQRADDKLPNCPYEQIVQSYHAVLTELPRVKITDSKGRKDKIAGFWRWVLTSTKSDGTRRATTAEEAQAWIRAYFERARSNDFLMGRCNRSDARSTWRCDFDFLLTEKGKVQVIEKTEAAA